MRVPRFRIRRRMIHQTGKPIPPRMMRADVTRLTQRSDRYAAKLSGPITSIPALQKAETAWKMPAQIPLAPKSMMNLGVMRSAPHASTMSAPRTMFHAMSTSPRMVSTLYAACSKSRSLRPIRLPMITQKRIVKVITQRPPIWISIRMTNWPKKDQWEKVGTVTSPVTQTEVVAVNSASIKAVLVPPAEETGSIRRSAPQSMDTRKPYARTLVAENGFLLKMLRILLMDVSFALYWALRYALSCAFRYVPGYAFRYAFGRASRSAFHYTDACGERQQTAYAISL